MVIAEKAVGVRLPVAVVQAHHSGRDDVREVRQHRDPAMGGFDRNGISLTDAKVLGIHGIQIRHGIRPQGTGRGTVVEPGMEAAGDPDARGEDQRITLRIGIVLRWAVGGQGVQPRRTQLPNDLRIQLKFSRGGLEPMPLVVIVGTIF